MEICKEIISVARKLPASQENVLLNHQELQDL